MALHLVKLSVGSSGIEELLEWQRTRLAECRALKRPAELIHVTRQTPRREGFAAGQSSLYWVIGGYIRARQLITDLREVKSDDGIQRCAIVFSCDLIPTEPFPRRPFQGWRYLPADEAPTDIGAASRHGAGEGALASLSPQMRADLRELRLI